MCSQYSLNLSQVKTLNAHFCEGMPVWLHFIGVTSYTVYFGKCAHPSNTEILAAVKSPDRLINTDIKYY